MNLTASKNWVDTHFHVFHAGVALDGARYVPQYTADLHDWMALAQGVGVTRGVCVQPSFLGTDNRLMLNALHKHPEVLRGVAVVAADIHPDELTAMHVSGVRGIRLNLAGIDHNIPEWTRAESVWHTMHQLGWHLEVHTDQGAFSHRWSHHQCGYIACRGIRRARCSAPDCPVPDWNHCLYRCAA